VAGKRCGGYFKYFTGWSEKVSHKVFVKTELRDILTQGFLVCSCAQIVQL